MTTLAAPLRTLLENTVKQARTEAVKAARAALTALAVDREDPFASMTESDRGLRRLLREKERQLGEFEALVQAVAYEQWHRMLFARFLAENGLLVHPEHGVSVTLAECAELAAEEGEPDGWMVAAKYAAAMLPGIFRIEDPLQRIRLAAEGRQALETELAKLPPAVFTSDDGLGWVYQFWQAEKKKEVNRSGRKIGGADIPPVTQLFTEPYMVQFLLHNTLGAWWAARHPNDDLVDTFTYLRLGEDGSPVGGGFPGWPEHVANLRVLDPCCGSGHFLVAAFEMLREMWMREEGVSAADAGDAVLCRNLFGLEIDPRCTEIAAFALALTAWKSGGNRKLPIPQVACSGIPVGDRIYNWTSIAGGDFALESNLRTLYTLFQHAGDLGSLINPVRADEQAGQFWETRFEDVLPHLERVLEDESQRDDPTSAVFGDAAAGAVRAAVLLAQKYHLVISNVPYLKRGNQGEILKDFLPKYHPLGKADLATAFIERSISFCDQQGVSALVTPQNWLFLGSYKDLREELLRTHSWKILARLGAGAFETVTGEVVNVALLVVENVRPSSSNTVFGIDASVLRRIDDKKAMLRAGSPLVVCQDSIDG